jgi:hypothetical protein
MPYRSITRTAASAAVIFAMARSPPIAASSLRRRKRAACQRMTFLPMRNDMSNILFDLIDM